MVSAALRAARGFAGIGYATAAGVYNHLSGEPDDLLDQFVIREAAFEQVMPEGEETDRLIGMWRVYVACDPQDPVEVLLTENLLQSLYNLDAASWRGLIEYVEDEVRLR